MLIAHHFSQVISSVHGKVPSLSYRVPARGRLEGSRRRTIPLYVHVYIRFQGIAWLARGIRLTSGGRSRIFATSLNLSLRVLTSTKFRKPGWLREFQGTT